MDEEMKPMPEEMPEEAPADPKAEAMDMIKKGMAMMQKGMAMMNGEAPEEEEDNVLADDEAIMEERDRQSMKMAKEMMDAK